MPAFYVTCVLPWRAEPNGQSIVKVTSFRPINEPFLDFLVELNWPAGRLVREYTFLLDPPEVGVKGARGFRFLSPKQRWLKYLARA